MPGVGVIRSKTFENEVCFRFSPFLVDALDQVAGFQARLYHRGLPTFQCLKCFVNGPSHKHIFFLEEVEVLNFIHLLFRSVDVLMSALLTALHGVAFEIAEFD